MSSSQLSPRFVIFVIVSLVTHLLELAACGLFCHMLFQQSDLKAPWFSVSAGLVIIPLVAVQLASAVFLLRRKGETSTSFEVTATAVLHVLQLGFISRHFGVLQESPLASKKPEIVEMLMLRMAFAITSGCTVFLTQMYLLFRDAMDSSWMRASYFSEFALLVTTSWALSTFRRTLPEQDFDLVLVSLPGTLLRYIWRACELLTRVIALSLFASIYAYWVLLVIGLHWLAMLICLCIPLMSSVDWAAAGSLKRGVYCTLTSFAYIFIFINTSPDNAVFRYTFYYVIIFLENATLVAIWLIQCTSESFSLNCKYVYVASFCFATSVASMIVYYKFFHVTTIKSQPNCGNEGCDACKSGMSVDHPPIPPRPESADNWLTQCQVALHCSQDLKQDTHDSLLDSERNSNVTISSLHARLQQKLASADCEIVELSSGNSKFASDSYDGSSSLANNETKPCRKKPPRKGKKKNKNTFAKSESERSSAPEIIPNDLDSHKRPVWLPSGDSNFANQLLSYSLETFNTADDERSSVATSCRGPIAARTDSACKFNNSDPMLSSASIPRNIEHRWFSDGYSTDRTELSRVSSREQWLSGHLPSSRLCHCLEHSHADSEVSSIMISANAAEPALSRELHYRNMDVTRQHPSKTVSSKQSTMADNCRKNDPRDVMSVHEACTNWILNRSRSVSSPASDPSHGPITKRKHSPKRKSQAINLKDKSTLQTNTVSVVDTSPSMLSRVDSAPSDHQTPWPDSSMEASLEPAMNKTMLKVKDRMYEISSATSDPRLTVRVVPGEGDDVLPSTDAHTTINNNNNNSPETDHHSKSESLSRHLTHIQQTSSDSQGTDPDFNDSDETNVVDIIYENIWQSRQLQETKDRMKAKNGGGGNEITNVKAALMQSSNRGREFNYVCSESEDSALPPETMNSSVDCFTPSETGSDLSMEIVI